ncbi:LysM peptidoglycan-binding domain-containing protein [Macrococcus epidermidis]|uniref:LysM peptidoglycan-binding domain-containing protein n=1 Tax=Macrococcus epidermidis TaxID=1902580 RepID=UPI001EF1B59B|nr:LysM peptidoglycan-binding domain-containing protein [Macrococcus epidermidis]MCG7420889.1 LysM peptidoglycan-binding domain-containing protein [Macrococcus epidermidis]
MKKLAAITTVAILTTGVATTQADAKEHKVAQGESLWTIADKYDTTIEKIKKINKLESDVIVPDQKLEVLVKGKYEVKAGDTLGKIARKFDVRITELKKWNKIESSKELKEGQLLIVEKKSHRKHVNAAPVKAAPVAKKVAAPVSAPVTTQNTAATVQPQAQPVQQTQKAVRVQQAPVQKAPVQQAPIQQTKRAAVQQTSAPAGNSSVDAHLRLIMQRESGGNPRAVNAAGYYGLFQFSPQTWAAVGGTGNPAQASEAEQWKRARILYTQHGAQHWSTAY